MSNKFQKKHTTTLTSRVAAIEVKMLHLQFRMKKIFEDQQYLNEQRSNFKENREIIKGMNNAAYNFIDMLVTMENLYQLISDIFATPEIREKFNQDMYKLLNKTKKITQKWKPVRNKLGGHIDIEVIVQFCEHHNYKGVFISDDLESDLGVLNMLMIESAVNSARNVFDIFGRDINLKNNGMPTEIKLLVDTINEDWNTAFEYFAPMMQFLYEIGKKEKLKNSHPEDLKGIVVGN